VLLRLRRQQFDAVSWYYPDNVRAAEAQREAALKLAAAQDAQTTAADPPPTQQEVSK
jgi:hypothetical protein